MLETCHRPVAVLPVQAPPVVNVPQHAEARVGMPFGIPAEAVGGASGTGRPGPSTGSSPDESVGLSLLDPDEGRPNVRLLPAPQSPQSPQLPQSPPTVSGPESSARPAAGAKAGTTPDAEMAQAAETESVR